MCGFAGYLALDGADVDRATLARAAETLAHRGPDDGGFHEEPGLLTGVGVLTDTDNTGGTVEAWYGDIQFRTER